MNFTGDSIANNHFLSMLAITSQAIDVHKAFVFEDEAEEDLSTQASSLFRNYCLQEAHLVYCELPNNDTLLRLTKLFWQTIYSFLRKAMGFLRTEDITMLESQILDVESKTIKLAKSEVLWPRMVLHYIKDENGHSFRVPASRHPWPTGFAGSNF